MEKDSSSGVEKKEETKRPEWKQGTVKRDYFKQKMVFFVGYNGAAFHGLQKNPGVVTVEESLEKTLHEAGFISDDNFGDFFKSNWTRASRTDKGVHAAMNGVALKVNIHDKFLSDEVTDEDRAQGKLKLKFMISQEKVTNAINSLIHKDIRVFGNSLLTQKRLQTRP
jgi:tRNA pseudouridine(38-40) synthase